MTSLCVETMPTIGDVCECFVEKYFPETGGLKGSKRFPRKEVIFQLFIVSTLSLFRIINRHNKGPSLLPKAGFIVVCIFYNFVYVGWSRYFLYLTATGLCKIYTSTRLSHLSTFTKPQTSF